MMRILFDSPLNPVAVDRGRAIVAEALLGGLGCAHGLSLATASAPPEKAPALLRGALLAACDVLDSAHRRGVRATVEHVDDAAALSFLLHGAARQAALAGVPNASAQRAIQCVFAAADALMPYLRRQDDAKPAAPPPPPTAPQTVNLELALKLPPGPFPVAIVSQPDTVSTTSVERKSDGRIGNTTTCTHAV